MTTAISHAPRLLLSKPIVYLPALLVVFGLAVAFTLSRSQARAHQDAMIPPDLPLDSVTTATLHNLPGVTPLKPAPTTLRINDQPPVTLPGNATYHHEETSPTGNASIDVTTEHHSSGGSTSSTNLDIRIESSSTTDYSANGSSSEQHLSISQP